MRMARLVRNGMGMRLIAQRVSSGRCPHTHRQTVVNGYSVNHFEEPRLRRDLHEIWLFGVGKSRADY